jgi:hypothetical protein
VPENKAAVRAAAFSLADLLFIDRSPALSLAEFYPGPGEIYVKAASQAGLVDCKSIYQRSQGACELRHGNRFAQQRASVASCAAGGVFAGSWRAWLDAA